MNYERPWPKVGDRIRLDHGPENPSTWECAAEVRAIVDDQALVCVRWIPRRRYHRWQVMDRLEWSIQRYVHIPKNTSEGPIPLGDA